MKRKFEHEEQDGQGRFVYVKKEEKQGEIKYKVSGEKNELTILSTEVSDAARGQGLGSDLVEKLIDYAADEGYAIESECSFASKVIDSSERMKKEVEKSGS
jgi:predicted GNAT family acetyltransferase